MWMARLTAFTIFWLQPSNVHLEKKVTSDDLPLIGYIVSQSSPSSSRKVKIELPEKGTAIVGILSNGTV